MGEEVGAYRFSVGKPENKRLSVRLDDDIKIYLRKI
jgi:hypothetical protein